MQAGYALYSDPRRDADEFTAVELGYPSAADEELKPYAEEWSRPTDTVYAFVPVEVVDAVLKKHGGIIGADFSNSSAQEWSVAAGKDDSE